MTEQSTEIATFAPDNPLAVLSDAKQFDELLGKIRAEVAAHKPDLTTAKGRAAIKSLAYKVTRTKTALDDAGKELNAAKRAEIDAVDAVRRDVRAKLDALAEEARKTLDEWEAAEEARVFAVQSVLVLVDSSTSYPDTYTADEIHARIEGLEQVEFDADTFADHLEIAINRKSSALETLRAAHTRAVKAEADAAELAKLRAAEAERAARAEADAAAEAERVAAKQREEQAAAAAKAAEDKRLADIKAAEDMAAEDARQQVAREAQDKIDAANAEAARLQRDADERAETERRAKADQAARDADTAHQSKVMRAAKEAIMEHGDVAEPVAKKIVLMIKAGLIPAITLRF